MRDENSSCGCFQWIVSIKRSVNERWAKTRNRLIQRFRKDHPDVKTRELVNETGTPDLVFAKRNLPTPTEDEIVDRAISIMETPGLALARAGTADMDEAQLNKFAKEFALQAIQDAKKELEEELRPVSRNTENRLTQSRNSVTSSVIDEYATHCATSAITDAASSLEAEARAQSATSSVIEDVATTYANNAISSAKISLEKEARESDTSLTSSVIEEMADAAVRTSLTNVMNRNESAQTRRPKTVSEYLATDE